MGHVPKRVSIWIKTTFLISNVKVAVTHVILFQISGRDLDIAVLPVYLNFLMFFLRFLFAVITSHSISFLRWCYQPLCQCICGTRRLSMLFCAHSSQGILSNWTSLGRWTVWRTSGEISHMTSKYMYAFVSNYFFLLQNDKFFVSSSVLPKSVMKALVITEGWDTSSKNYTDCNTVFNCPSLWHCKNPFKYQSKHMIHICNYCLR